MKTLVLSEITGKKSLIDPSLTEPVFEEIKDSLQKNEPIAISFKGLERIITAVLNVAIGKLYAPELKIADKIDTLLTIVDANADQLDKVAQVKKYAKMFYDDPDRLTRITAED